MITDDSVAEDIYASSDSSLADSYRPEDSDGWCEQYGDKYDSNTEEEDFFEESSTTSGECDGNHPWTVNNLEEPWTFRLNAAPEDDDTPIPCSFPGVLAFMEVDREESLKIYLDQ
eukprot:gene17986-12893_t